MKRISACKRVKLNNNGSAIVTVIVVVAFISILATTILYLSGMNYFMKMTDLKTKRSFYEAETALEEIKAALAVETAIASSEAYSEVAINYALADDATRSVLYEKEFLQSLQANWAAKTYDASNPLVPKENIVVLRELVDTKYRSSLSFATGSAGTIEIDEANGKAYLRGVTLQYTDEKGYTTIITTDYVIVPPQLEWGVEASQTLSDGMTAESVKREDINLSEWVRYCNWVKK